MFSVCLVDVHQYTFIRLVQCFRQIIKNVPYAWRERVAQCFQLAVHPPEPVSQGNHL